MSTRKHFILVGLESAVRHAERAQRLAVEEHADEQALEHMARAVHHAKAALALFQPGQRRQRA